MGKVSCALGIGIRGSRVVRLSALVLAIVLYLSSCNCVWAFQSPLAEAVPVDDLSSLAIGKISTDKETIVVRVPGWKIEYETKVVDVPVTVETEVEQTYEENGETKTKLVKVPKVVMQKETQTISNLIPQASVRGEVPVKDMKVWTTKGKLLSTAEVQEILAKTTYLFALTAEPAKGKPPMDPFFASALRSDVLLVYSPKLLDVFLESIEEEEEPAAPSTKQSGQVTKP